MTTTTPTSKTHPDVDIEQDIQRMMNRGFMPLRHDKHQINVRVQGGEVTLSGYVKSATTQVYLLNTLREMAGVKAVHTEAFHNDEAIRLQIARLIPPGVYVTMEYGAVILEGHLPQDSSVEALVGRIATVPGVRRVLTAFS